MLQLNSVVHVQEVLDQVAQGSLLNFVLARERLQVGEGTGHVLTPLVDSLRVCLLLHLARELEPRVLEGFSGGEALAFFAEDALDKVFSLIRNIIPCRAIKAELTFFDAFDNFLV